MRGSAQPACLPFGVGDPDRQGGAVRCPQMVFLEPPAPSALLCCLWHSTAGTLGDMPRVPWKLSGRDGVHRLWLFKSSPVPHLHQGRFSARTQGEGTWRNGSLIFILALGKQCLGVVHPFSACGGEHRHREGTQPRCATAACSALAPPRPQVPVNHGKATKAKRQLGDIIRSGWLFLWRALAGRGAQL